MNLPDPHEIAVMQGLDAQASALERILLARARLRDDQQAPWTVSKITRAFDHVLNEIEPADALSVFG